MVIVMMGVMVNNSFSSLYKTLGIVVIVIVVVVVVIRECKYVPNNERI